MKSTNLSSRLNKRITIQTLSTTTDSEGYRKETWSDYRTVWAYCKPHSANEYYKANAINSKASIKFNIRYFKGLDTSMRIKYKDKFYNILSIENVDEANIEMWILGEVIE